MTQPQLSPTTPHQLAPLRAALTQGAALVPLELRRTEHALDALARQAHVGGSRTRPIITLLAARATGSKAPSAWRVAACVELVHSASRIIDDLLDGATARRGREAFHLRKGERQATLAGTTLVASAFGLLSEAGLSTAYLADLVNVIQQMAEAEASEEAERMRPGLTVERRGQLNRLKTGALLGLSAQLGAASAGATSETIAAVGAAGGLVGEAYQTLDDLLDWTADPRELGKQVHADLSNGRVTLPLQFALQADPTLVTSLQELWHGRNSVLGTGALRVHIVDHLEDLGAFQATADHVTALVAQAVKAMEALPSNPERAALQEIATSLSACAALATRAFK